MPEEHTLTAFLPIQYVAEFALDHEGQPVCLTYLSNESQPVTLHDANCGFKQTHLDLLVRDGRHVKVPVYLVFDIKETSACGCKVVIPEPRRGE